MDNHNHYESINKVYSRLFLKKTKNLKLIRLTNKKNQLVKAVQHIKMKSMSGFASDEEQVQELKTELRAYNDYVKSQIMQLKEATIDYEWLFQDTGLDVADLLVENEAAEENKDQLIQDLLALTERENLCKKRKFEDAIETIRGCVTPWGRPFPRFSPQ